ncbi:MAG: transcription-repair coupling factor [Aestuariivita sp.]|nr:transcription-repair coupling factor [Aestuariivita sp.]
MKPNHIRVGGAPEGFDAKLILNEVDRSNQSVIHIVTDDQRLVELTNALTFFDRSIPVISFPAWDCLPYDRMSPNVSISAARMSTLAALSHGTLPKKFVLLTTLNAATQRIPKSELIKHATLVANVGDRVIESTLREFLAKAGFSKASTVMEPGDFAIRGGIIDLYPSGGNGAIRLDFFGDTLDGVRRFDVASQRTIQRLNRIELAPVNEVLLDQDAIARFRDNYRFHMGSAGTEDPLYEAVSAGRKQQGIEHWLPFFCDKLETIFDYLPHASITLDDNLSQLRQLRWETVLGQFDARQLALRKKRSSQQVFSPIKPQLLYLDNDAWNLALQNRRVIQFSSGPQPPGPSVLDAKGRIGRQFFIEQKNEQENVFKSLVSHIGVLTKKSPVVLASYSDGARERLSGLINDEGLTEYKLIDNANDIGKTGLHLAVWALEHGFESPELSVISEQDVLGERLIRQVRKSRRAENFLTEVQSLSVGDLVVHIDHGIGRYNGLEIVNAAGAAHECIVLEYAQNTKLYLPAENIELLSKYGHENGILDRLGSVAWQARKARIKNRIHDIAHQLLRVAAERELFDVPVVETERHAWEEFSAGFPYQETEDQTQAIEDVVSDLFRGKPMDRLICGDVGFGKTEVAMRAAFAVAMSGFQVAVIAPTTLLARQHFASFVERFQGFPIKIKQLSRLVTSAEADLTRKLIADGSLNIVIGTHALLSTKVAFNNLGLLVIDEEQRFGVTHKEKLKQLKRAVHVLTLTATPIPRTLQLSLTGLRELSLIRTPPVDRLAIRTYVSSFDPVTVREALLREYFRGGQSFFVVPRIQDIPNVEQFLENEVPEVRFVVAHGQMPASDLDARINAFYERKYDVLLATSIIESGLDIPTANTLIVYGSDQFGLSQLYQIRGRVGRSKTRAYAYLTTKPKAILTDSAIKRLRVLGNLDSLGVGFLLASQDLQIRGAGNLLGEEQSGQIREVGYELYQSMLEDTINKIKRGMLETSDVLDDQWVPQINLGVNVLIPESYVPDLDLRLGLYRRLGSISRKVEVEGFAAELIDRFGKLPNEIHALLLVIRLKAKCKRAGVSRIDIGRTSATFQFHDESTVCEKRLADFLIGQRITTRLKDNKILVTHDWKKSGDRIRGAFEIVRELSKVRRN